MTIEIISRPNLYERCGRIKDPTRNLLITSQSVHPNDLAGPASRCLRLVIMVICHVTMLPWLYFKSRHQELNLVYMLHLCYFLQYLY